MEMCILQRSAECCPMFFKGVRALGLRVFYVKYFVFPTPPLPLVGFWWILVHNVEMCILQGEYWWWSIIYMYSDVSCTSLVVPYFLPLFPWHLGTGSLSFMCLIRFFKCFSPISCIHVKMPLCTPLCHLDNYTCIVHISLPLSFTCVDPGPFTLKVSIYPSFCQYAANVNHG